MGKLQDILRNSGGSGDDIRDLWDSTAAAGEMGPLPAGNYSADIVKGELTASKTNSTPGYTLEFVVTEGEFLHRRFWHTCYLTPLAVPGTKRDLAKIGVSDLSQLDNPLPAIFHCSVRLVLHKDDQGEERNKIRQFAVTGFADKPRDAYAPTDVPTGGTSPDVGKSENEGTDPGAATAGLPS